MKRWMLALAMLALIITPVMAQTIGGGDAEETGVANDQNPTAEFVDCHEEVCAYRHSDFASWSGMDAKALDPAVQGGDVVARVRARFSNAAFQAGNRLLMTTCEDQFGPDRCWLTWIVAPQRDACIGTYCNYVARDLNICFRISGLKKFYSRVDFVDGNGQYGPRVESGNTKYERACQP